MSSAYDDNTKQELNRIITIPNILSIFRLILIPIYAVLYMNAESTHDYIIAGSILAVSCVTDLFDGWIARNFNQISNLGKALDPVADKATQGVMLICAATRHPILWFLFGFFALKEGFQLVMGCWYLRKKQMLSGALFTGKLCTTVLFIFMIIIVCFPNIPSIAMHIMIILSLIFMTISLISYILAYFGKNKKVEDLILKSEHS